MAGPVGARRPDQRQAGLPSVTGSVAATAVRLADRLPLNELETLAEACSTGPQAVAQFRQGSTSPILRAACDDLVTLVAQGHTADKVAGALLGAGAAVRHERGRQQIDAVWTGPYSVHSSRLTSAVVVDLIEKAKAEILLVSYATQSEPSVAGALHAAADNDIKITLLLERSDDNPGYHGHPNPFPDLAARRLSWPQTQRGSGSASMHAKLLVVDRTVAFVGSANVTGHALAHNLECGLLVTGGHIPRRLHDHIDSLCELGLVVARGA